MSSTTPPTLCCHCCSLIFTCCSSKEPDLSLPIAAANLSTQEAGGRWWNAQGMCSLQGGQGGRGNSSAGKGHSKPSPLCSRQSLPGRPALICLALASAAPVPQPSKEESSLQHTQYSVCFWKNWKVPVGSSIGEEGCLLELCKTAVF